MNEVISQYATPFAAAVFIGIGCGFSCGSSSIPFLTTYIMGTQKGALNGFKAMLVFTFGKIITFIILGLISSILGKALITSAVQMGNGSIFENVCKVLMNVVIIATGIVIFINSIKNNGKCSANSCTSCASSSKKIYNLKRENSYIPLLIAGVAYAVTPCPPLIGMLACAINMTPIKAAALLLTFGIFSSTSPLIVFSILAGHFSSKIRLQAPKYNMLFQRIAAILLIFIGIYPIINRVLGFRGSFYSH